MFIEFLQFLIEGYDYVEADGVGHYPVVWCGAILPCIHRHRYTQYDKTLTRVWHKEYEDDMKMI